MLHRLCGSPSIPLSFNLAVVLPRWSAYCVCCGTENLFPTPSTHRLQRGLPGYLILFAPHAFVPQRQLQSREPPSQLVFLLISTHFTATNPVCSPRFRASASVTVQRAAFATGVPPNIYAFHRYTRNSTLLSCTQVSQFQELTTVEP